MRSRASVEDRVDAKREELVSHAPTNALHAGSRVPLSARLGVLNRLMVTRTRGPDTGTEPPEPRARANAAGPGHAPAGGGSPGSSPRPAATRILAGLIHLVRERRGLSPTWLVGTLLTVAGPRSRRSGWRDRAEVWITEDRLPRAHEPTLPSRWVAVGSLLAPVARASPDCSYCGSRA